MFAYPSLTAVTTGCTDGTVNPPGTKTVLGLIVMYRVLLLVSVTVTPLGGAGEPNRIGKGSDWPVRRDTVGRVMELAAVTATFTARAPISGGPLTLTTLEPAALPLTGTVRMVSPAGMVTLAGTLTIAEFAERSRMGTAAGAREDRTKVRCCVAPRAINADFGPNSVAAAWTVSVRPVSPAPEAVMLADPNPSPVT
jgi:hypothetical protein